MDKKFIIVQDEATANTLIVNGFQLISKVNDIYTFINQPPQNLNFNTIDKKKIVYDDILRF